jgi:hypothetical protein
VSTNSSYRGKSLEMSHLTSDVCEKIVRVPSDFRKFERGQKLTVPYVPLELLATPMRRRSQSCQALLELKK